MANLPLAFDNDGTVPEDVRPIIRYREGDTVVVLPVDPSESDRDDTVTPDERASANRRRIGRNDDVAFGRHVVNESSAVDQWLDHERRDAVLHGPFKRYESVVGLTVSHDDVSVCGCKRAVADESISRQIADSLEGRLCLERSGRES